MTEIPVSTHEDWSITRTSDSLIRFAIFDKVSLWHPYDFSLMAVEGSQLATQMILDRFDPEELHDPT
jgi:hypothetical protein